MWSIVPWPRCSDYSQTACSSDKYWVARTSKSKRRWVTPEKAAMALKSTQMQVSLKPTFRKVSEQNAALGAAISRWRTRWTARNIKTNTGVEILPYTLKPIPIHFRTKRMSWPFWLYIELFIRWNYIHISIVCTYTIDWVINQVWPADCKRAHPEDYQVPGTSMKVAVALKCTRMQVGLTPTIK